MLVCLSGRILGLPIVPGNIGGQIGRHCHHPPPRKSERSATAPEDQVRFSGLCWDFGPMARPQPWPRPLPCPNCVLAGLGSGGPRLSHGSVQRPLTCSSALFLRLSSVSCSRLLTWGQPVMQAGPSFGTGLSGFITPAPAGPLVTTRPQNCAEASADSTKSCKTSRLMFRNKPLHGRATSCAAARARSSRRGR